VLTTVDTLPSQRRPLTDRPGMVDQLMAVVADGPKPFGEVASQTTVPAMAGAYLLHLLWHRQLGMNLGSALGDATRRGRTPSSAPGGGNGQGMSPTCTAL
jgi:hypothetical protein